MMRNGAFIRVSADGHDAMGIQEKQAGRKDIVGLVGGRQIQHASGYQFEAMKISSLFGKSGGKAQPENSTLSVMSFNVRFASNYPPNAWPDRRPVMQECLRASAPDVIGTQEGGFGQLNDMADDLPEFRWIGVGREGGGTGEFTAIFYRTAKLEALDFNHFWLSDTPSVVGSATWGNTDKRMVTWAKFRERSSQKEFFVFNTYLDNRVQEAREKSARLIRDRVQALKTSLPVFLIGDFNAVAGQNPVYHILTEGDHHFMDSWTAAPKRTGEGLGTVNGFKEPVKNGLRIDWVLFQGPAKPLASEIVTFAKGGQFPSDHLPVMTQFEL
jgi:endonuclease/exonuclease/phosphatase family metal-dependent hydrolase